MEAAYMDLRASMKHGSVKFVRERDFQSDLLAQLEAAGDSFLFFLVDDIVFTDRVQARDLLEFSTESHILSLRLAPRITHSYTQGIPERPPDLRDIGVSGLLEWNWRDGELDWGYAFSVDGHVFRASEILELARGICFHAPNSFESRMQVFAAYFRARKGLCFATPKLFNVPCNRVQTEFSNLHGEMHQSELLLQWEKGARIDFRKLYGHTNSSCHEIVDFCFTQDNLDRK
jgi:hypothetical protein